MNLNGEMVSCKDDKVKCKIWLLKREKGKCEDNMVEGKMSKWKVRICSFCSAATRHCSVISKKKLSMEIYLKSDKENILFDLFWCENLHLKVFVFYHLPLYFPIQTFKSSIYQKLIYLSGECLKVFKPAFCQFLISSEKFTNDSWTVVSA